MKIIAATNKEGYQPEKKRYAKPKPYIMSESLKEYIRERDMWWLSNLFICEETKEQIRERYGID